MAERNAREAARRAYGDLHDLPERDTRWHGQETSVGDFCEIAKAAVPTYNDFEAGTVCNFLKQQRDVRVALAREGSPAVYVSGTPAALTQVAKAAIRARDQIEVSEISYATAGGKWAGDVEEERLEPQGRGTARRWIRTTQFKPAPKRAKKLRLWWD